MARLPRVYVPGYPVHLVVRGNNRQEIFKTDGDRIHFHRCLVEVTRRHGLAIHAYVFMTNHVHLVATGECADAPAKVVQSMGRRYVSYFNYLHGRTGTLWEGRYRSCLVETDRYLLACHRYAEMNPVRAGMVAVPGRYPWSSFRCNARGVPDDLVTPHSLYMGLGWTDEARRAAYRALFEVALGDEMLKAIRYALNSGWALGGEAFCDELEARAGRRFARKVAGRRVKDRAIGLVRRLAADAGLELSRLESDPNYPGQGTARSCEEG
jgi:putative transposase